MQPSAGSSSSKPRRSFGSRFKKRQDSVAIHPQAVFAHTYVNAQVLKDSLVRLGEYVAQHGLRGEGPNRAARDLLLKEAPRVGGQELQLVSLTSDLRTLASDYLPLWS